MNTITLGVPTTSCAGMGKTGLYLLNALFLQDLIIALLRPAMPVSVLSWMNVYEKKKTLFRSALGEINLERVELQHPRWESPGLALF